MSRMSPTAIGYIGRGPVRELPAVGRPGLLPPPVPTACPHDGRPCDQLGGVCDQPGGGGAEPPGPCDQPGAGAPRPRREPVPRGPDWACDQPCGAGQAAPGTGHDCGVRPRAPGSLTSVRSLWFGH